MDHDDLSTPDSAARPRSEAGSRADSATGDADTEPRYRSALDADRHRWPSASLFDHYRRHYHSEIARGGFILGLLRDLVGDTVRGSRVLDIGCGDAGVPIAFARAGARAVGLEPGAHNLPRARIRALDHGVAIGLARGVAEHLPFPDASFDLVVLDNVLEHVSDRERVLTEIRRVLVPRGLLYIVTPKPFAALSLAADPHYGTPGLVLLPRAWQRKLVEWRLGAGAYDVGRIPTRWWVRRALARHGFRPLASPRDVWVRYVEDRIARPSEVRPGVKRRLAGWLARHPGVFRNVLVRWALDVGLGANFFVARKTG